MCHDGSLLLGISSPAPSYSGGNGNSSIFSSLITTSSSVGLFWIGLLLLLAGSVPAVRYNISLTSSLGSGFY